MKKIFYTLTACFLIGFNSFAQENQDTYQPRTTTFFSDMQFGGGLGLAFGSGFTNIAVSPMALKPITEQFSAGLGLQFNYLRSKGFYESTSYGANILGIYSPAEMIQLSAELEQLRVRNILTDLPSGSSYTTQNFWNTALFLGAGYTTENVTIGVRYNVLYKKDDLVYNQAWMPFIRVFF
ncbi:MAG: hypothetical protein RSF68_10410 [Myroides sp.]